MSTQRFNRTEGAIEILKSKLRRRKEASPSERKKNALFSYEGRLHYLRTTKPSSDLMRKSLDSYKISELDKSLSFSGNKYGSSTKKRGIQEN